MIHRSHHTAEGAVSRVQRVGAGLFVLRYASSAASRNAPHVRVEAEAHAGVTILTDARDGQPIMYAPGDALVVHASRDSQVRFIVSPSVAGGSADAHFTLERVGCSLPPASSAVSAPSSFEDSVAPHRTAVAPGASSVSGLSVLAHVSRRGDVVVAGGEWISGPDAPLAIEGIELVWPGQPVGVDVLMAAVVQDRGRHVLQPVKVGTFLGTRQKAAPIVGLTLNLTGPAAHNYQLVVDGLFLGGAVISKCGVFIEMSGETGSEPLVGLRLNVVAQSAVALASPAVAPPAFTELPAPVAPALPAAVAPSLPASSRVRVFRMPRNTQPTNLSHTN